MEKLHVMKFERKNHWVYCLFTNVLSVHGRIIEIGSLVDLGLAEALNDLGSINDAAVGSLCTAERVATLLDGGVADEVGLGNAVKRSIA